MGAFIKKNRLDRNGSSLFNRLGVNWMLVKY